jgi:hypothetical protein
MNKLNTEMKEQEEEFEYINEDATKIILENISNELIDKLDFIDIMHLLELKDEYFKKIGIIKEKGQESICTYPIDLDAEAMNLFIITNALQYNILLKVEEMEEIMNAEFIYLEINGQLDEPSHLN